MNNKRRYREWTADDTATLQRMSRAGYSDLSIADHLDRDRAYITRKRQGLKILPGINPLALAMLARVNLRRRMAA